MSILVFVSYVGAVWIKFGVQPSISASYDCWKGLWQSLFVLFCWGFAFPAMVIGIEVTPLMFFACAGIMFVGAAYEIKIKWVYEYHMVFAISGIIFSQLAIYFGYDLLWVNIVSVVLSVLILLGKLYLGLKNHFWWIELVAFAAIVYAMGTKIIPFLYLTTLN